MFILVSKWIGTKGRKLGKHSRDEREDARQLISALESLEDDDQETEEEKNS